MLASLRTFTALLMTHETEMSDVSRLALINFVSRQNRLILELQDQIQTLKMAMIENFKETSHD